MSREEYLKALSRELRRLPKDEYEKAMSYYEEYFADAGEEHVDEVIADLGTPKEVAAQITMDAAMERMQHPGKSVKRGFSTIWVVILAVCAAPIALPVAIAVLMLVGAILVAAVCALGGCLVLAVGCFAGGIVTCVSSLFILPGNLASGLACLGCGMFVIGLSILAGFLFCFVFKWIVKGIKALVQRIVRRRKKK